MDGIAVTSMPVSNLNDIPHPINDAMLFLAYMSCSNGIEECSIMASGSVAGPKSATNYVEATPLKLE